MTQERKARLLEVVKTALGLLGSTFHDALLSVYIDEVIEFMRDAGVADAVFETERINGAVVRGVSDLWNYGQGDAKLSPYFTERVIQLTREGNTSV